MAGVLACLARPPASAGGEPPYRIYNLGNSRSEDLMHFVAVLERALGRQARIKNLPMQPGDLPATYADIAAARRDFGFKPATSHRGRPAALRRVVPRLPQALIARLLVERVQRLAIGAADDVAPDLERRRHLAVGGGEGFLGDEETADALQRRQGGD